MARRVWDLLPSPDLWRLVSVRGLRSLVQGYLMVVFAIYLGQIGFSAWLIGVTLTIGGIISAGLTLATGVLSDRFGRRPFLLVFAGLYLLSGLILAFSTATALLIAVSALAGIGRGGAGGQAGAFAPAEQAIIAEKAPARDRTRVFAINAIAGTLLSSVGALLAGIPELLRSADHFSLIASYRPLYLGVALVGAVSLVILWPVTERVKVVQTAEVQRSRRRRDGHTIKRIAIAGAFNGFGMGFLAGLIPYWMYVRFGVSPAAIGPVVAASSLTTSALALVAVRLANRFGEVRVITGSRVAAAVLSVVLPFSPAYPLAAALYALRTVSSAMAMPVRQSYTMGIVDAESRGSAAGVSGVARRLPAAASPALSGYWIGIDALELPFFASALFMGINAVLYYAWFHAQRPLDLDEPEQPDLAAEAPRPASFPHSSAVNA
ncbi:MAG: MFS transporter [Chloroflexota bacterium]